MCLRTIVGGWSGFVFWRGVAGSVVGRSGGMFVMRVVKFPSWLILIMVVGLCKVMGVCDLDMCYGWCGAIWSYWW